MTVPVGKQLVVHAMPELLASLCCKNASWPTYSSILFVVQPARLLQPVRHSLGYVLLKAGKLEEAEQVYRQNLAKHPANGFGLLGLSQSLNAQGQTEGSLGVMEDFNQAWKYSDATIITSSPSFAQ